ncbi:hypothetical protein DPMN_015302 [Dreissena polymorpha]|uniref:Uncharacterized protein n=1 Tax=Dreissena polymorpha TaxID=45954 RepID=A0A9D4S619_DREPO|nr:hypothetical protein DPMN_015302 [Dreissena polymorpha]
MTGSLQPKISMKHNNTGTIFELFQDMSKFHEDNVSSRLFTCFHFIHIKKTAPPPGAHVFPLFTTIFKLVRDIHIANLFNYIIIRKKTPPPWRPCFLQIQTIFELN